MNRHFFIFSSKIPLYPPLQKGEVKGVLFPLQKGEVKGVLFPLQKGANRRIFSPSLLCRKMYKDVYAISGKYQHKFTSCSILCNSCRINNSILFPIQSIMGDSILNLL